MGGSGSGQRSLACWWSSVASAAGWSLGLVVDKVSGGYLAVVSSVWAGASGAGRFVELQWSGRKVVWIWDDRNFRPSRVLLASPLPGFWFVCFDPFFSSRTAVASRGFAEIFKQENSQFCGSSFAFVGSRFLCRFFPLLTCRFQLVKEI